MKRFHAINICRFSYTVHKVIIMKSKISVFKTVAIAVVVIFAAMLAFGIYRYYHTEPSFVKLSEDQLSSAKTIATTALQNSGKNVSDYEVQVMPTRMRGSAAIVSVNFRGNQTTEDYLVDLNSSSIVMHSETEYYGNFSMPQSAPPRNSRWFHTGFMPQKER
jgi:uncharacterized membrane protein YukC